MRGVLVKAILFSADIKMIYDQLILFSFISTKGNHGLLKL